MNEGIAHLLGDYVLQSDWMAQEKTERDELGWLACGAHALTYTACFLPLTRDPRALAAIGATHYVIDHWRLARYLVWAKNQLTPDHRYRYPLAEAGPHGYHQSRPDWLAMWLMFLADNAVHLAINHVTLRRYG